MLVENGVIIETIENPYDDVTDEIITDENNSLLIIIIILIVIIIILSIIVAYFCFIRARKESKPYEPVKMSEKKAFYPNLFKYEPSKLE